MLRRPPSQRAARSAPQRRRAVAAKLAAAATSVPTGSSRRPGAARWRSVCARWPPAAAPATRPPMRHARWTTQQPTPQPTVRRPSHSSRTRPRRHRPATDCASDPWSARISAHTGQRTEPDHDQHRNDGTGIRAGPARAAVRVLGTRRRDHRPARRRGGDRDGGVRRRPRIDGRDCRGSARRTSPRRCLQRWDCSGRACSARRT